MKRSIHSLPSIPLNHDSGEKKVLFNHLDADTPCRQISIASFHAGDVCEEHTHETLDEHFYWQQGSGVFIIEGQEMPFEAGDYIYVPARSAHKISFSQDSQCICIGIALDWESAAVVNPVNEIKDIKPAEEKNKIEPLLASLFAQFKDKGYTAEDFFGGCALCGDANDFALDIIDEAVMKAFPETPKFDRDRMTSRLYSELHQLFEQEERP